MCVRTNVDINDKLLKEVMERLGAKTKKRSHRHGSAKKLYE